MKFGNYNLASARTEKSTRSLLLFRFRKVKNTANQLVGRFHHKIGTFRKTRSESPLSFRASLFDRTNTKPAEKVEKFSPADFPKTHFAEDNHYVFGSDLKRLVLNHRLLGRRNPIAMEHLYSSIGRPEPDEDAASNPVSTWRTNRSRGSKIPQNQITGEARNVDTRAALEAQQVDEELEYQVLKDYFDTYSYSEIIKDADFKNYLSMKNYNDILEYLQAESVTGSAVNTLKSRKSMDATLTRTRGSRGDYRSMKKNSTLNNTRNNHAYEDVELRKYATLESTVARRGRYKTMNESYTLRRQPKPIPKVNQDALKARDANINDHYSTFPTQSKVKNKNFTHSLKRIKNVFNTDKQKATSCTNIQSPKDNVYKENIFKYHDKNCSYARSYCEIINFCQKFFTEASSRKKNLPYCRKKFSESDYNHVIGAFIKSKGYTSTKEYVEVKFGKILNRALKSNAIFTKPKGVRRTRRNPENERKAIQRFLYEDMFKTFDYVSRFPPRSVCSSCGQLTSKDELYRNTDTCFNIRYQDSNIGETLRRGEARRDARREQWDNDDDIPEFCYNLNYQPEETRHRRSHQVESTWNMPDSLEDSSETLCSSEMAVKPLLTDLFSF
ncbi:uncharacterized protein LOC129793709 [Lutzomyia longipalpis]|uniref:uncharacterized protein LOC129793709 n=1 Tax=Lutzomyia longipalpis TaxID=7200 RepID=UPI0024835542|nr:uncharacterized protein LOC129793709 [Lutzomyia longipalpis]